MVTMSNTFWRGLRYGLAVSLAMWGLIALLGLIRRIRIIGCLVGLVVGSGSVGDEARALVAFRCCLPSGAEARFAVRIGDSTVCCAVSGRWVGVSDE